MKTSRAKGKQKAKKTNWGQLFSQYISPIGGMGMFVATIILLVLTAKYLGFTKDMTKMMQEEFEIRLRPIIEIDDPGLSVNWATLTMGYTFHIYNRGSYAVYLLGYSIKYWPEELIGRVYSSPEKEINEYISPNEKTEIKDSFVLSALQSLEKTKAQDKYAIIEFYFNFLDVRGKKFTEKFARKLKTYPQ